MKVFLFALAMVLVLGVVVVGNMEYEDEQKSLSFYCDMHATYLQTNGEYGWPDYKGIYEEECHK